MSRKTGKRRKYITRTDASVVDGRDYVGPPGHFTLTLVDGHGHGHTALLPVTAFAALETQAEAMWSQAGEASRPALVSAAAKLLRKAATQRVTEDEGTGALLGAVLFLKFHPTPEVRALMIPAVKEAIGTHRRAHLKGMWIPDTGFAWMLAQAPTQTLQ